MHLLHALPRVVVLAVVLIAAGTDLQNFRIRNVLTVPLLLSGIVYHGLVSQATGLSESLCGIIVGTLPFFVVYAKGGMGAGDLKLMAGVGAWMGPWFILHVVIVSGLATGCYSAGLMLLNRLRSTTGPSGTIVALGIDPENDVRVNATDVTGVLIRSDRWTKAVPFGAMVALGVIVSECWIE